MKSNTQEERASEAEINNLPKYIFKVTNGDVEQPDVRACKMTPMETNGPNFSTERVLLTEEAVCFLDSLTYCLLFLKLLITFRSDLDVFIRLT